MAAGRSHKHLCVSEQDPHLCLAGVEVVTGQRRLAGQAQILSATIKPLPALAALSTTKTHPNKHKPAIVSHLLLSLCVSGTCVWEIFSRVFTCCFTWSLAQGLQPQPRHIPKLIIAPRSSHHLPHLPKEKRCSNHTVEILLVQSPFIWRRL